MKYFGLLIAGLLLLFVLSDVWYVFREWSEFRPRDVRFHIQFHLLAMAAFAWHLALSVRSWSSSSRAHFNLVLAFIMLVGVLGLYLMLLPMFRHIAFVEGSGFGELLFSGVMLAFGGIALRWSWRVAVKKDA